MNSVNTHAGDVRLVGGRLCLDFCNTVDDYHKPQPKEYLQTYGDLLVWGQHSGALNDATAHNLTALAARQSERAIGALEQALALRKALWRLFSAADAGVESFQADLAALNQALAAAPQRTQVVVEERRFVWAWPGASDALEQILWQVVWSATDLLTTKELASVRECEGANCSWFFVDTSRNRSRRWCSMEDCGNRAKARRHYARRRQGERVKG